MDNNRIIVVSAAIRYIEDHLTEKLDLEVVAEAVNYSKFYLHRMFSETVGLTVHEYVQRRQLTEAAKLLVFSERPIIDIALISGYESQQAFTTVFKAFYKQSPHQFREREEFYPLQLRFTLKTDITGTSEIQQDVLEKITFAADEDIPAWMELVRLVIDGFPRLTESEYLEELQRCIDEKRALMLKDGATAVGAMIFSRDTGSIDFLGVHPQYRNRGITKAFLDKAVNELMRKKDISITTYREGDKADTGYREEYKRIGFAESELLIEYGYPTQRFVLKAKREDDRNVGN